MENITCLLLEPRMHALYRAQLTEMFRLRHRVLVERLNWLEMKKPDGLDIDQYDTTNTTYILSFNQSGVVIGCSRLNPSTGPNLCTHSFGQYATFRKIPAGRDTLEYSRFCVDIDAYDRIACNAIKAAQVVSVVDYCIRVGVRRMITFTLAHTLPQYVAAGIEINALGLPVSMDGTSYVSAEILLDPDAVTKCCKLFDMDGSPLTDPGKAQDIALRSLG